MLVQVEATQLGFVRNAKSKGDVNYLEYHEHCEPGEGIASDNAKALHTKLTKPAAVEKTVVWGAERRLAENTHRERAPDTAETVDWNRPDGIVNTHPIHPVDAEYDQDAGDQTNEQRRRGRDR